MFDVGDRVELVRRIDGPPVGSIGTVRAIREHGIGATTVTIGVWWDGWTDGHDCSSRCRRFPGEDSGWFVLPNAVRLLQRPGVEVIATLLEARDRPRRKLYTED